MDWLLSVLYGFISGFSEFIPISSLAHQNIVRQLFDMEYQPLQQLLIHGAALLAVTMSCRGQIGRMRRERRLLRIPKKRRKRQPDMRYIQDYRLLKIAALLVLLPYLGYSYVSGLQNKLQLVSVFMLLNGFILFIPQHLPSGNKDSRALAPVDGFVVGLAGALSILPGISLVGATSSAAAARGSERSVALNFALLLCIPVLIIFLALDVYAVALSKLAGISALVVVRCLLSAAAAYIGSYLGIALMRFLSVKTGFSGFAYYSWGAALFVFVLYLTIY